MPNVRSFTKAISATFLIKPKLGTYLDENNTDIGHEMDSLANVYYDTNYAISVGYHTSYKHMDIDSVKVEILKEDKVIKECSTKVDKNKFNF